MDVLLRLQIGHALRDVLTHLQQLHRRWVLPQSLSEVRQQAAVGQKLSDDVNGSLFGADAVQLDQVLMAQLPGLKKRGRKLVFLTEVKETAWCVVVALSVQLQPTEMQPTMCRMLDSFNFAYIMILASSMKSSSDMEPSLIILMATSCWPCHFPYFTTPN